MLDFFPIIINGCFTKLNLTFHKIMVIFVDQKKNSYYFNNSDLRDNRIIYNKGISIIRGL